MCYTTDKTASSADVLSTVAALSPTPVQTVQFFYTNDFGHLVPYAPGAILSAIETAYADKTQKSVTYVVNDLGVSATHVVVFLRNADGDTAKDIILQVNARSGTARRIERRVVTSSPTTLQLDLPHLVEARKAAEDAAAAAKAAEEKRLAELREQNLKTIPVPTYTELTWTVESLDATRPHPFPFFKDGQAALESAFQESLTGGSKVFAYQNYLIQFTATGATQTNVVEKTVRQLYRVEPTPAAAAAVEEVYVEVAEEKTL